MSPRSSVTTIDADLRRRLDRIAEPGPVERRRGRHASPEIAALLRAGTRHVYVDSARMDELEVTATTDGAVVEGIDGNTVNQPLLVKALDRFPEGDGPADWARELRERTGLPAEEVAPLAHDLACARVAREAAALSAERSWETSLQLHMRVCEERAEAVAHGRLLRELAPACIVKVPFLPHAPDSLLAARDLERAGIPVNFTSTFSARQAVAAAILADVARTNVFMGRLDAGLSARRVGAHATLEAQRALLELRREGVCGTLLIAASVRDVGGIADTAGCDAYTAPPKVLQAFLAEGHEPEGRLETSWSDDLGIPVEVLAKLPRERIERLWRVEPEFVDFLLQLAASREYRELQDGDGLRERFERAGFGDFFHAPPAGEWSSIRADKLPDLDGPLVQEIALDTLFSLHADADFEKHQATIDAAAFGAG